MKIIKEKEFYKSVLAITIPIALQNLISVALSLMDTVMLGRADDVGVLLSASSLANQPFFLLNVITFGIAGASTVLLSQYWGKRDMSSIRSILSIIIKISFVFSLLAGLTVLIFPRKVLGLYSNSEPIIESGVKYLRIIGYAYFVYGMTNTVVCAIRNVEIVKVSVVMNIVSFFINVFLNWVLIFGNLGAPKMGIEGAALATTISAWIGFALLVGISVYQKNVLVMPIKEYLRFSFDDYKAFMVKASPVIINELLWGLGTVCNNVIYSNTGYENFAACTILRTVESLCLILFIGLNDGGAVIVGKTIGEGNYDKAYRSAKRLVYSTPIISAVLAVFVIIFREKVVYLFNMSGNITQKTVNVAMAIIVIYAVELCFRNIPYTMICAIFRSGGDSFTGAKFDIICLWFLAIPITLFTAFGLKLAFPMVMLVEYLVEDIPKCITCLKHFKSRKWIKPVAEFDDAALK